MKIGNLELNGNAILAPMAGVCDRAFRELCKQYGASFTVGEMASSKGLIMSDKKTRELLFLSKDERPSAVQLFGDDLEIMAEATKKALEFNPDVIDINMGCPAPKIAGNGGGSALMKNPALAGKIVEAVKKASTVPVTVKMRIGWDEKTINAPELAKIVEKSGADAICVHGRTKVQMYAPPVNLDIIKEVKENVSIPVIGNGDINSGKDAEKMMKYTNCDAVMVGRGALGRPWVFKEINAYFNGEVFNEPDMAKRIEVLKYHIEKLCEYKGEYIGMREARKHAAWYIKGIRGAAKYRSDIGKIKTIEDLYDICDRISESCSEIGEDNGEFDKFCFNNI